MRLALLFVCAKVLLAADSPEGVEFFEKNIRPVLAERCYSCHSSTSKTLMGGLQLDSRAGILQGGNSGKPAVVPGHPEQSLLLKALRRTGEIKMPPGKALDAPFVDAFEDWIKMGAPDPRTQPIAKSSAPPPYDYAEAKKFWSFQAIADPAPPEVKNPRWNKSPVDRFIFEQLQKKGLTPVSAASKRVLLRRATFDLTGLPPTPDEMDAFLKDRSANAFEKIVDRLLATQAYGERWGRHWLDIVRYGDTSGCNSDYPIPPAYRYRNYVIRAFQHDKPYDLFLREQLAGDLLEPKNDEDHIEKVVATGYLAIARRFGSRNNEFHLTIDDIIDNVGKGMLGISTGCARCHDHKFDPIPQRDYYSMYGIFNSTKYAFPGTEIYPHPKDFTALGGKQQQEELARWEQALAKTDDEIEALQRLKAGEKTKEQIAAERKEIRERRAALEANPPQVMKAYAVTEGTPANARVMYKGDPKALREVAPRGFLQILGGQQIPPEEKGSGRLELAQWITDAKNPLMARVMVNRIWQWHFGKGIVGTPNDFGKRGDAPSNPQLLDWLASRFIASGYSIKAMHKLMMLTQAYQLASEDNAHNGGIDPKNAYQWRFDRRRLEAEEIRDSMLAVSGTLDPSMAGEQPFPPQREWKYTQHTPFVAKTSDYENNKRSVYMMQQRIRKQPYLNTFDGADSNSTTAVRPVSNTTIQALYFMDDALVFEKADALAVRVGMAYDTEAERVGFAYRLLFGRPAAVDEIRMASDYLRQARAAVERAGVDAEHKNRAALASYLRVLMSSDEFLFLD